MYGKELSNQTAVVGEIESDESGDLSCIMAYTQAYLWSFRYLQDTLLYRAVPALPVGYRLCTSKAGTGINANNQFFGDAKFGNCLGQLRVRDK